MLMSSLPQQKWTRKSSLASLGAMPSGNTAKGQHTRARILSGAIELLLEQGTGTVTLDEIRARTETSKSQLFHYFPDGKEQLLLEVAQHETERILQRIHDGAGPLTTRQAWRRWRDQMLKQHDRHGEACPLYILASHLAAATPGEKAVVSQIIHQWNNSIRRDIEQMQSAGEVAHSVDASKIASAITAAVCGGTTMTAITGSPQHLTDALDYALNQLSI
ncbi:AcrR family transcriptional regulator [Kutzneria viridogrisea]|uniref:AcrR family transcriptional regulator n=2 Tax=Kutzneria viridogrisea TaxID=47990 RepID=A0ABR6B9D4_9PSEU|nr:AcrR family transcriptional regulator [Kutzneria viridogrisea]